MSLPLTPLFVPADRPERYSKAAAAGPGAIIIDLEDAVSPGNKDIARQALAAPGNLPSGVSVFVRINALGTPWHEDDVRALKDLASIAGIMLPKVEAPLDAQIVSAQAGGLPVVALVETALGVSRAREIAATGPVMQLAFGSVDFCADLGVAHTREALISFRSELVLASRLSGLSAPVDGVTLAILNVELVEDDARHARDLGFGGKLCIHPSHVAAVRRGFAPNDDEVAWAARILSGAPEGAVSIGGEMIDAPVRARARMILARSAL